MLGHSSVLKKKGNLNINRLILRFPPRKTILSVGGILILIGFKFPFSDFGGNINQIFPRNLETGNINQKRGILIFVPPQDIFSEMCGQKTPRIILKFLKTRKNTEDGFFMGES